MPLSKSRIPYLTHTWAITSGCLPGLPCWGHCWARGMAHRFGRDFAPAFHPAPALLRQRDELLKAAKQVLAAWFRSNSITVDDVQAVQALRAAVTKARGQ